MVCVVAEDEVSEGCGGFGLHAGDNVGVDLHRECDGGVAEPFGHDFRLDASAEKQCRVRMSEGIVIMPTSA